MAQKNKLYYGDNLEVLRKNVKDETVDLCYIDPPFNSKRNYNQIYNNVGKEDVAQAQAFVDTWTWNSIANEGFDEITSNKNGVFTKQSINLILGLEKVLGKGSLLSYLVSMTQRIAEIYRVLKPTGSFYLHCDPTASHYLKLVLDAIFCSQGGEFMNEIVWCYSTGGRAKEFYPRKHDIIFWYTKSKNYLFHYDEVALERDTSTMHEPIKYDEKGRPYQRNFKNGKEYKYYLDKGVLPNDWWTDIQAINPSAKERLGYPTQKPETLLERIIKANSKEGDVILDCYCGCGTTIAVAEKLKRNWIGIDITYQSISLIMKRLEDSFGKTVLENITLSGIPEDFESAIALANKQDDRVRKEFEKWIVLTYSNNRAIINDKKGGDGGIDGTAFIVDYNDKNEQDFQQVIFSVKSNKTLSPTVIRDLYGTVEREKAVMGFFLTLYSMPNLVKEAEKYGNYQNKMFGHTYPKITVISVQDILEGKKMYLPTSVEVLKKAERKAQEGLSKGIFDE
jgi:site-specific DNA-methyltransferase (adenine-specific)